MFVLLIHASLSLAAGSSPASAIEPSPAEPVASLRATLAESLAGDASGLARWMPSALDADADLVAQAKQQAKQQPAAKAPHAAGAAGDAELAKKLANPLAELISVPLQFDYDSNMGPGDDGWRSLVNVQPVIPFSLNQDWNVISRTILPVIAQHDVVGSSDQFGTGDITQSLFFTPKAPTSGGVIWGAGPAFLIPTATDDKLGTEKWGIGPTVVMLEEAGSITAGFLANHIWSFAGNDDRPYVSQTFFQPFCAYRTENAWTYTANLESTYDWERDDLAIPLNLLVTKVTKFGAQPVSIGGGLRYWLDSADDGPEGWGLRLVITFLFPE